MKTLEKVYQLVAQIPSGKVSTYSKIALVAGIKNPRQVGTILHQNPDPRQVPCHRVVNAQGKLAKNFAFGGLDDQKLLLEKENVKVVGDKLDLNTYFWDPKQANLHVLKS